MKKLAMNIQTKQLNKVSAAVILGLSCAMTPVAQAAEAAEENVERIVVTGMRSSLAKSLLEKRDSVQVTDGITAEDIGKFPDTNISESLQRIPGVTINRSFGQGTEVNVRGLGPQFSIVEINGMTGTSSNSSGRFGSQGGRGFDFDMLASELFQGVVVQKSPNAATTEGAIAGVISLETPKPFHFGKDETKFSASLKGANSEISGDTSPRASMFFSKNFDDKFGFASSLAYSDTTTRADSIEGASWTPFSRSANAGAKANAPKEVLDALVPRGLRAIRFQLDKKSLGATATMQYRPNDDIEITFDNIYTKLDTQRWDDRPDAPIEGGNAAPSSYNIVDGRIDSGVFPTVQNRIGTNHKTLDETLYMGAIKVDWILSDDWSMTPYIGYSTRNSKRTSDLYSFRLDTDKNTAGFQDGNASYAVNGDFVPFTSTATDFRSNPEDFALNVFILRPTEDSDEELSLKLDFERLFDNSALDTIEFGFRYSDREKERTSAMNRLYGSNGGRNNASEDLVNRFSNGLPTLASVSQVKDFNVSGSGMFNQGILAVDPSKIADVFYFGQDPSNGALFRNYPGFAAQNSYKISEETLAAYVQANFELEELAFNFGLRVISTDQTSAGFQVTNIYSPKEQIVPQSVDNDYVAFLPSANFKYDYSDDVVLRATYARTITRPDLFQLAPSTSISSGPRTGNKGNPGLSPYTSDQIDLGAEWYFDDESLVSFTYFHKEIDSLIESSLSTEKATFADQNGDNVTDNITFNIPVNGQGATIKGIETSLQAPLELSFLPEALNNFGVVVNYTFTDTSVERDASEVKTTAFPGISKNSFNATLYFDNGTFDARLAYAWRDDYLYNIADDGGVPSFVESHGLLDFSSSYKVSDNFIVQLEALNLTNEQEFKNSNNNSSLRYGVTELDRIVMLGARYNF